MDLKKWGKGGPAMKISFPCPGCGKTLNATDRLSGRRAKCPHCMKVVVVPAVAGPLPPASAKPPPASASAPTPSPSDLPSGAPSRGRSDPSVAKPRPAAAAHVAAATKARQPAAGSARGGRPANAGPAARWQADRSSSGQWPPKYLYCVFGLALLPLAISLMTDSGDAFDERLERTLEASPEAAERFYILIEKDDVDRDDLLELFPAQRIHGAHLGVGSWMHWLYAFLSAGVFFAAILTLFPRGRAEPLHMVAVALGTATLGIVSLLAFQWVAQFARGFNLIGGNVIVLAFFYIVKFIGFSYGAANDPETGFLLSFLGFTCGVGFCEELVKATPVLMHVRGGGNLLWRGVCMWGLASGVGFGVAEGIIYAGDFYNGISSGGTYVIRFVSCVALHAVWAGAVGISVYNRRDMVQADADWGDFLATWILVLGVPMILHGLYDTLLKRDYSGGALLAALLSFAWLIWMIERARAREPEIRRAAAPR